MARSRVAGMGQACASTQDGEELEVAMIASQRHDGYKQRVIWPPGRKEVIWEQSPGERCWWVVW